MWYLLKSWVKIWSCIAAFVWMQSKESVEPESMSWIHCQKIFDGAEDIFHTMWYEHIASNSFVLEFSWRMPHVFNLNRKLAAQTVNPTEAFQTHHFLLSPHIPNNTQNQPLPFSLIPSTTSFNAPILNSPTTSVQKSTSSFKNTHLNFSKTSLPSPSSYCKNWKCDSPDAFVVLCAGTVSRLRTKVLLLRRARQTDAPREEAEVIIATVCLVNGKSVSEGGEWVVFMPFPMRFRGWGPV